MFGKCHASPDGRHDWGSANMIGPTVASKDGTTLLYPTVAGYVIVCRHCRRTIGSDELVVLLNSLEQED